MPGPDAAPAMTAATSHATRRRFGRNHDVDTGEVTGAREHQGGEDAADVGHRREHPVRQLRSGASAENPEREPEAPHEQKQVHEPLQRPGPRQVIAPFETRRGHDASGGCGSLGNGHLDVLPFRIARRFDSEKGKPQHGPHNGYARERDPSPSGARSRRSRRDRLRLVREEDVRWTRYSLLPDQESTTVICDVGGRGTNCWSVLMIAPAQTCARRAHATTTTSHIGGHALGGRTRFARF